MHSGCHHGDSRHDGRQGGHLGKDAVRRGRPSEGAREAILGAARALLREEGLAHLTTREVARRAGVSEASVFYHFQDKAGLLFHCLHEALAPLKTGPAGVVPGESLAEALTRLSRAMESFHDDAMPVLATVQSDADLRREFSDRLLAGDHGLHQGVTFIKAQLEALAGIGLVRPDADLESAAFMLIGSCFLRSWQRHLAGGRPEPRLPDINRTVTVLVALLSPMRNGHHTNDREEG